jgi:hypothetical protein
LALIGARPLGSPHNSRTLERARKPLDPEIKERLIKLWAWRIHEVRTASDPRQAAEELGAFGWWFVSGAFDDEWALDQLIEILPIGGKVDAHHERLSAHCNSQLTTKRVRSGS